MAEEITQLTPTNPIIKADVSTEMQRAYLDYAMSVIVSRALPDIRDGLKPVHRRIIYAMQDQNMTASGKFYKCAAVVGEVLKKYHPHGDMAVYDSLVRMAQDFSLRYPLIVPQGNFGCFTKDTKVKLTDSRDLSFEELVKEDAQGKRNYTYTVNSAGLIAIAEIKKPRLTRKDANLVKVILDNGVEIKCTPNHQFMLKNGSYKEAKELKVGESLMPIYLKLSTDQDRLNRAGYLLTFQNKTNDWIPVHHLADNFNLTHKRYSKSNGRVRHHINFNKLDNSPDNILRVGWEEHWKIHYLQAAELHKNPNYRQAISEGRNAFWAKESNKKKYRLRMTERNKANWQDPEYREKMSKFLSEMNKEYHKNHPELAKLYATRASATMKRMWQNPEYRQLFHEKIVAANQSRLTNNTGKRKFLNICKSVLCANLALGEQAYEQKRQEMYNYGGATKWETGIKKYFHGDSNLVLWELNKNHRIVMVEALASREDVYDLTIDHSHNFALAAGIFVHNSIDGDPPAAQRYTECKLSLLSEELYKDIDKDTVDFLLNDLQNEEPTYLPSLLPNLLLNGASGIAVGMATNIPPHNLNELIDGINFMIDKATDIGLAPEKGAELQVAKAGFSSQATVEELVQFIKGPDFPTGGTIYDQKEMIQMYATGKGRVVTRAKMEIEDVKGKTRIIVTEIPYQVNKATLIAKIADLVKEKRIEGISDLRDESNREGMRIMVELKKDAMPKKVQNQLYKYTQLQSTFNTNMVALLDNEPRLFTLKTLLEEFIKHRQQVVIKRTLYLLKRAKEREHILLGLKIALDHLDEVIKLIRASKDADTAKQGLIKKFDLSEIQAQAILDMQLRKLAALERQKIEDELKQIAETIKDYQSLLATPKRIIDVVKKELLEVKQKFGDERKTKVVKGKVGELTDEDLVVEETCIISISNNGYIKRLKEDTYKKQGRGGKGVTGQALKEEDEVAVIKTCNTHDYALFFTNTGRVYKLRVWEIPESSRIAKGTAIVNFLNISQDERLEAFLPVKPETLEGGKGFVVFVTEKGVVKKTSMEDFANIRSAGILAIRLEDGDKLSYVKLSSGNDDIMLTTAQGQSIRFSEEDVRAMGRAAAGVTGIRLARGGDSVVGAVTVANTDTNSTLIVVTESGYGKKTSLDEYKVQHRAGTGILTYKVTDKTGKLVSAQVQPAGAETDILIATQSGKVIRLSSLQIPVLGRATQGVRLIRLDDDKVTSVSFIEKTEALIQEEGASDAE